MDEVAQIREKIDLASFIQEYIPVKKAGRNFKANCPFHTEKTPSFMINPERQIWHCFGCSKGGDVYSFLMEFERLEFPEALRTLAKRTGVTLASRTGQIAQTTKKEKTFELNSLALEYYHYILTTHNAGQKARVYLENRGVSSKIIQTFMLGFAPPSGSALTKYLIEKKRIRAQDIIDAGLAARWGNRLKDFFQARIIFPLIDHRENIVGFAGRVTNNTEATAKYINTRETLAYHKGDHLYAISLTKDSIRDSKQAILCEGELDVISCFQNGITNVVGIKGTALTENQVNLLKRFAEKITFCFDGDKAGREAIKRSLPIVEKIGLSASVIEIPQGKDPDEALRKDPGLFKKAVREDIPVYDYLIDSAFRNYDPSQIEAKKKITGGLLPLLSGIKNEIIKEHYLKKIASILDTSYESVAKELEKLSFKVPNRTENIVPVSKRPKEEVLEEYLLSLIIQSNKPKTILEKATGILSDTLSKERACQKILYHLLDHFTGNETFDGKKFLNTLPSELIKSYDTSMLFPLPPFDSEQKLLNEVQKISSQLRISYIHHKMKSLAAEIKTKENAGLDDEVRELKRKYARVSSLLSSGSRLSAP
jgi:DNA primase